MKKSTPILDMYYDFCENGIPNKNGLCAYLYKYPDFELLKPTLLDREQLVIDDYCVVWWASGVTRRKDFGNESVMTPLRQNIVLLMACLNGEM
jgi:hypothetical protein